MNLLLMTSGPKLVVFDVDALNLLHVVSFVEFDVYVLHLRDVIVFIEIDRNV